MVGDILNFNKKLLISLLLIMFLFVSCSSSSEIQQGALIYQGELYYNVPNDEFSDYMPDNVIEIARMIGYIENTALPSDELTNNMYISAGEKIYILNDDYSTLYIWNHNGCLKFTQKNHK